jgi:hypothetical protein
VGLSKDKKIETGKNSFIIIMFFYLWQE